MERLQKIFNVKIKILVGDLRNSKFIRKLSKINLKIDNVINNAAGENQKHFLAISEKELNDMLSINLKSTFLISQIFAKKMIKYKIKGNIISISSQLGHIAAYNRSIYCMTKFGLEGLTKGMSIDLAKYNIRVNTVCPTFVVTPMTKKFLKSKKFKKEVLGNIPLGKFAELSDVSSAAVFLASDAASMITGTSLLVDGGWTAR